MPEKYVADMPLYYRDFVCKCGECRSVCCHGWGISLTMAEYYRLIGMNAPKRIRHLLDGAFCIVPNPTEDRYAVVRETPDGDCPILDGEGYCALQRACGEKVLPFVCRTYPRAFRMGSDGVPECMCSGSCEKTVEMLMTGDTLRFERVQTEIPDEAAAILRGPGACVTDDTVKMFECLDVFANATGKNVEERLRLLAPMTGGDETVLDVWLSRAIALLRYFNGKSVSISDYCVAALEQLDADGEHYSILFSSVRYAAACRKANALLPHMADWYINLCMNHMFYSQFPSAKLNGDDAHAYKELCCVYMMLRVLTVCNVCASDGDPRDAFADAAAAVFRLTEHTDFVRSLRITETDI